MTAPIPRVWYLKGGHATDELKQLYARFGELPIGGPDQYLLAVMHWCYPHSLTVATLGDVDSQQEMGHVHARTYAARPLIGSRWSRRLAFLRASASYFMDLLRFKPTRVLCGIEGPIALLSWLAARISNAQFWYFSHCAVDLPATSSAHRFANRFILRHANRVIANGPYLAEEAARLGASPSRITEFNVGLDAEHEQLLAQCPTTETHGIAPAIVYAGRIEADKGVFDLLQAFNALRSQNACRLIYLGTGSALNELKQQAASSHHQAHIEIRGQRPLPEVFSALKQAAVVVTPTQSRFPEGRCKTLLEAFFAGTPVVAPDFGPFPYTVITEQNGLLYAPDDVAQMTSALSRIITDRQFRDRLAQGARASGEKLKSPNVSFTSAIHQWGVK